MQQKTVKEEQLLVALYCVVCSYSKFGVSWCKQKINKRCKNLRSVRTP